MNTVEHDVFISYRRDGGSALAQLLYHNLAGRGYSVFMDVRDLRSGEFDESLKQKIQQATDFILLITPNLFERCTDENDWLRIEIETAFDGGCNIVPLRSEETEIPETDDLPGSISKISKHQCVTFNSEYCDAGLDRVSKLLRSRPRLASKLPMAVGAVLLVVLIVFGVIRSFMIPDKSNGTAKEDTALGLYWQGFGQRKRDGKWEEFLLYDGITMYSGDQFRLVFSPDADCNVYVVNVDTQGSSRVLFPNQAIEQDHFCQTNKHHQIPDGINWFTLDNNTGNETIYLLASYEPLSSLESILESAQSDAAANVALRVSQTAHQINDNERGVTIEADGRLASINYDSGKNVQHQMNVVAGRAQLAQIIHIKHLSLPKTPSARSAKDLRRP